jgi:hypothetical protein
MGGGVLLEEPLSKSKRIYIPARLEDNPHILNNDPGYIARLNLLPEQERLAKVEGRWDAFAGQVFPEFRTSHLQTEPENAVHVCEPFEIPEFWPRVLAIDWGYAAHTWAGWAAISPDSRLFLYKEYYAKGVKVDEWSADIKRMSQGEHLTAKVMDPSAWFQRGDPLTIAEQFHRHTGIYPERADNDRIGGRLLVHEYLRWKPRPPRYVPPNGYDQLIHNRIFRMQGSKAAEEYKNLFKPDRPETNLPKLQIFNTCKAVIDVLPVCVFDEKRPEDVQNFDGDDAYDGLRYLLKRAALISGTKGQERRLKLNKIEQDYESDGDATRYHMRLKKHVAENPKVVPINRSKRNWRQKGRVGTSTRTSQANW